MPSPLNLALLITAALLVLNIIVHVHRQSYAALSLHGGLDGPSALEQRVAELQSQLSDAQRRLVAGAGAISHGNPGARAAGAGVTATDLSELPEQGWHADAADIPAGATVWVTFVNGDEKYRGMMMNWAYHLRQLRVHHLVVAFDDVAAEVCRNTSIPHIRNEETLLSTDFRTDFTAFRRMGSNKPLIVLGMLEGRGFDTVVLSDVDTVWLRDPTSFLARHPTADVLISTDCLSHEVEATFAPSWPSAYRHRCGHMPGATFGLAFNTGVVLFRNRNATRAVLREWRAMLTDPGTARTGSGNSFQITDQLAFNMILQRKMLPVTSTQEDWRVVWCWDHQLRVMPLPALLFTNGHVFFYQHLPHLYGTQAYVVHATFQRHHTAGKRARLREAGLWLADPPSYHAPGPLMSYVNDVQRHISALQAAAAAPMPDLLLHFHAMSYQLAAMRDAFAVARVLGRTLVLPRFTCYCDQDWYASVLKGCRVDASDLQTPFSCPLDVLINPDSLDRSPLPYRVHAFLQDARTPQRVRQSAEPVFVGSDSAWLWAMRQRSVGGASYVATGSDAAALRAALQRAEGAQLLVFRGLQPGTFGGFGSADADREFDGQMAAVFRSDTKWCCSGEQPIDVAWITWQYELPPPLAGGVESDWRIPRYLRPEHCARIAAGAAGELNAGFTLEANHPCNFTAVPFQLPERLSQVTAGREAPLIAAL